MHPHPENDPKVNELLNSIGKEEMVEVWCVGCQAFRPMNALFAKYVEGEIKNCSKCR